MKNEDKMPMEDDRETYTKEMGAADEYSELELARAIVRLQAVQKLKIT